MRLNHTTLPEALPDVRIRNLKIGDASIDLILRRHGHTVAVEVMRKTGDIEIVWAGP